MGLLNPGTFEPLSTIFGRLTMAQAGLFKILSDDQIEQIHRSALSILSNTGAEVREDQAFEILRKGRRGCQTKNGRNQQESGFFHEHPPCGFVFV